MKFEEAYEKFSPMWESPFRFYHTKENHLDPMLKQCDTIELKYFALFHDIVYNPYSNTNEEDSDKIFVNNAWDFEDLHDPELVSAMIAYTKTHEQTISKEVNKAIQLDMGILYSSFKDLVIYENLIFKEFQKTPLNLYIQKRVEFLEKYEHIGNISELINYVKYKKYSIGIYPGNFNPFTIGHLDILDKAEKLFDKVIVVRAVNIEKVKPEFDMPNLANEIINHSGLITDLFNNGEILIRGIRGSNVMEEIEYMDCVNRIKEIPFIHLVCDPNNRIVSSTYVNSLRKYGCQQYKNFIVE
jgi:cytidyltransferase-like protein